MPLLRVGNVPIILPKLTIYLCSIGCEVRIVGRQACDYKVAQLLLDAKEWQDVPDLMAYNSSKKEWLEYNFKCNTTVSQGEFNTFEYDLSLFNEPTCLSINKITNLVRMYGHAKLEITTMPRYGLTSPVLATQESNRITKPMLGEKESVHPTYSSPSRGGGCINNAEANLQLFDSSTDKYSTVWYLYVVKQS